jgi:cytochrome b pre-mRNA-processing protein 3
MPLINLKKRRQNRDGAAALYRHAVTQARLPVFYACFGVPDTLDGRFDLVALHVFLVLQRLRQEGAGAKTLAQGLFDVMFADMDQSLRELGVGDLGVGRRVKAMAQALYGRIAAYEEGLGSNDQVLAAALQRNLFGTVTPRPPELAALCAYLRREAAALTRQPLADLSLGRVAFGTLTQAQLSGVSS